MNERMNYSKKKNEICKRKNEIYKEKQDEE